MAPVEKRRNGMNPVCDYRRDGDADDELANYEIEPSAKPTALLWAISSLGFITEALVRADERL